MIGPLLFAATGTAFLAMALITLWHLRWVRRLPGLDALPGHRGEPVRCSVVIAARDEDLRAGNVR